MQVSAYAIVNAFGIDALSKLYSVDNAQEIQRCREEYASLANDEVIIKAFNDGNSIYEVVFNVSTFECWRTDYNQALLEIDHFLNEKIEALAERDRIEKLFNKESDRVLSFVKHYAQQQ